MKALGPPAVLPQVREQPGAAGSDHPDLQRRIFLGRPCLPKANTDWSFCSVQIKLIQTRRLVFQTGGHRNQISANHRETAPDCGVRDLAEEANQSESRGQNSV